MSFLRTNSVETKSSHPPVLTRQEEKKESSQEVPSWLMHERNTQSGIFSFSFEEPALIENFDEKTGILTLRFASQRQAEKFHRKTARHMAEHKQYAPARRQLNRAGIEDDILSLQWIQKALSATADRVRPKRQDLACSYDDHADQVAQKVKGRERRYKEAIRNMKKASRRGSFDLEALFHHFHEAVSLNSLFFDPYAILLPLADVFVRFFPEEMDDIVKEAYNISPIETFNGLFLKFLLDVSSSKKDSAAFEALFLKYFPLDVLGCIALNQSPRENVRKNPDQERNLRKGFAENLAEGINALLSHNLPKARSAFLKASCFHISDQRPYLYQALIDVESKDYLSALKLAKIADQAVDWTDAVERDSALRKFCEEYGAFPMQENALAPKQRYETSLLLALIKLVRAFGPEPEKGFYEALQKYAQSSEADLIWMSFAIDLALPHIKDEVIWMEIQTFVPALTYHLLRQKGADLSIFEEHIAPGEENNIEISIGLFINWPETKIPSVGVDEESFLETFSDGFFEDFLWKSLQSVGLEVANWIPCNQLVDLVTKLQPDSAPLNGPLIELLLKRLSKEGSWEQKIRLLAFASNHPHLWPDPEKEALASAFSKWHLEQPILPKKERQALQEIQLPQERNSRIKAAIDAWDLLTSKNQEQAQKIVEDFFAEWIESAAEKIDPAALSALFALRAFSASPEYAEAMPGTADSFFHAETIRCALSLFARDGALTPYIIPKNPGSELERRELYRLYIGQRRQETDAPFLERLQKLALTDLSDLRNTKKCNLESATPPDDSTWIFPFVQGVDLSREVSCFLLEEEEFVKARKEKNESISQESPSYVYDRDRYPDFVRWVQTRENLTREYRQNPRAVCEEFDKTFPGFPKRADFLEELGKKVEHLAHVDCLEVERPEKKPAKRFWQLVRQASEVIATVHNYHRNEASCDLVVENEEEACLVARLIYEWSYRAWLCQSQEKPDPKKFADAFHGPEIHVFGKGPRIPHFNAGIYHNGDFINVHIFFK